MKNPRWVL